MLGDTNLFCVTNFVKKLLYLFIYLFYSNLFLYLCLELNTFVMDTIFHVVLYSGSVPLAKWLISAPTACSLSASLDHASYKVLPLSSRISIVSHFVYASLNIPVLS